MLPCLDQHTIRLAELSGRVCLEAVAQAVGVPAVGEQALQAVWGGRRNRRAAASCAADRAGQEAGRSPASGAGPPRAATREKRVSVCGKSSSSSRSQAFVGTPWTTTADCSPRCHCMRRGHPLVGRLLKTVPHMPNPRYASPVRRLTRRNAEVRLEYQVTDDPDMDMITMFGGHHPLIGRNRSAASPYDEPSLTTSSLLLPVGRRGWRAVLTGSVMEEELTESEITEQLAELGIEPGGTVLMHASMRSVGKVKGGAVSVLNALRHLLGPDGTLVVPTFTSDNSDTSSAHQEKIRGLSDEARVKFCENMPPFDPATTPSTGMGVLAETVRCHTNSTRSAHPQTSFAALGAQAAKITRGHRLDCHLGKHSPLARLYDMRAHVLLLGVGFDRCTAFHLGEYRVIDPPRRKYRCVIRKDGLRQWWEYEDVALDDSDFGRLGEDFERVSASGAVRKGRVGSASCRLLSFVDAVDYAQSWLLEHRATGYGRNPQC